MVSQGHPCGPLGVLSRPVAREGLFPDLHEGHCEVIPRRSPAVHTHTHTSKSDSTPDQPRGTLCSLELYSNFHRTEGGKKSKMKSKTILNT